MNNENSEKIQFEKFECDCRKEFGPTARVEYTRNSDGSFRTLACVIEDDD
jgi:hypothetical protein